VLERNRASDTFGWGVVLSDDALGRMQKNDPKSTDAIRSNFAYWDDIAVVREGERIVSGGHGFAGIGRKKKVKLEVIIESVLGLNNIDAIAGSSKRLESLHFGSADYAASAGMRTTNIGGPNKDYVVLTDKDEAGKRDQHWSDLWHYATVRMVAAARAHGLRPIDGPFGDYSDEAGFIAQAQRTAVLGCEGKWAIHPSQVALANRVFTPPADEVKRAEAILAAMKEGAAKGMGAVALNGKLIDLASIRQAEVIVRQMQMIAERTKA
jgi:malyl-CoA/(S)-citramalyl-CoA lyase